MVVIAEAGVNHDGDLASAHRLVDVAAEAGADAVKFQTFDPAHSCSAAASATPYQRERGGAVDQRSLLDALTLPTSAWSSCATTPTSAASPSSARRSTSPVPACSWTSGCRP